MTYEEALQFWHSRVNYEARTLKPDDLKLERTRALLEKLGNPHDGLRVVHIAGSKGKGSTSAMLAAVLQRAGQRTGLFTSPHLCDVRERIQVDGVPIGRGELAALMEQVAAAAAELDARQQPGGTGVTFFEIATALGFLHFQRQRVDIAVVEVGLGGRFDATNVCRPELSIITSISFDHTQQLGNTLAQIAFEKAGIVKPGRPVVSGVTAAEARQVVVDVCRERTAPLRMLGRELRYQYQPGQVTGDGEVLPSVTVTTDRQAWPALHLRLFGEHQAANATLVVAAVEELRAQGITITDDAVATALATVHWPARLEVVSRHPLVILDCAHNVASAEALAASLRQSFAAFAGAGGPRRFLVFAGSQDKDLGGMLQILAPHFDHIYLTRFGQNPRSVPPEQLAQMLPAGASVGYTCCGSATEALALARAAAGGDDLICVTGSVFLAGELRPQLVGE